MCNIPQLSVLLPALFSVLINDLHSAAESMLIKFADNMKLEGTENILGDGIRNLERRIQIGCFFRIHSPNSSTGIKTEE